MRDAGYGLGAHATSRAVFGASPKDLSLCDKFAKARRVRSPERGTRPTGPWLQEEKIFHDLVEFSFDDGAGRNILLSRCNADFGVPGVFFSRVRSNSVLRYP